MFPAMRVKCCQSCAGVDAAGDIVGVDGAIILFKEGNAEVEASPRGQPSVTGTVTPLGTLATAFTTGIPLAGIMSGVPSGVAPSLVR